MISVGRFYGFGNSGGGGGNSLMNPLTDVIFVDKNTATGTPNGSISSPYKTIQSAIDYVVSLAPSNRKTYNIVISPDTYDEELTVDITGRRILLTSWGSWNLGVFNDADWSPTPPPTATRRNINIIGSSASVSGVRCGLTISSFSPIGQRYSTHQSYISGCRISGAVIVKLSAGGASLELDLQAEVFGTDGSATGDSFKIDAGNGNSAPILQIYLYNGRWHGKFNGGGASNLQNAEFVRFGGLLTTPNYSLINTCRFNTGISVSGGSGNVFPDGIINTRFDSGCTFTGLARVDTYTNYWLVLFGIVPTGGKTLLYSVA